MLGLAAVLFVVVPGTPALASLPPGEPTMGIDRLSAGHAPLSVVRGVATFDAAPTALDVAALRSHGLVV